MTMLTNAGLARDVRAAEAVIRAATGVDPRPWFRRPFGAGADSARVIDGLAALGYRDVGWHVDGRDWAGGSPRALERRVVRGVRAHGDGAVVLLHGWPTITAGALPAIVRTPCVGPVPSSCGSMPWRLFRAGGPARRARSQAPRRGRRADDRPDHRGRRRQLEDRHRAADRGRLGAGDAARPYGVTAAGRGRRGGASAGRDGEAGGRGRASRSASSLGSLAVLCLAGMDLPSDRRELRAAHGVSGLAGGVVLRNDTEAALRAGSPEPWGVAVTLGSGLNAVGIAPSGREARFAGLGPISGDRGGGGTLGMDALGAAVRPGRAGPAHLARTAGA